MPTCAYTYITRPEQSKPDGDAPPQTYGVPRYCIAIPTTPPCVGGGGGTGAGAGDGDGDGDGATVDARACWLSACRCAASRSWSWRWTTLSCSETLSAASIRLRRSSRLDDPRRTASPESWPSEV